MAQSRRGAVALISLGAVVMMLGVGAVALNWAWLNGHQTELRQASEAAALAGAARLLDPSPETSFSDQAIAAATARVEAATQQAIAFFASNSPAVLRTTEPDSDLVAGWCEDPTSPGSPFMPWTGTGPVNAISVRGALRRTSGQSVAMWFGSIFGVNDAEPAARATASMDQRVYGFRPVKFVAVPLVPLLVPAADRWPSMAPGNTSGLSDNYSVNDRTGTIAAGPDGIAEITLTIPISGSTASAGSSNWIRLDPVADWSSLVQQIDLGLDANDLAPIGGQLALAEDGSLSLIAFPQPDAAQAAPLRAALLASKGKKRIWPRGTVSVADGQTTCHVTEFVAGRVIDCTLNESNLSLVVQACTLQTCTALLRSGTPRNAWIGKLILNQ